MRKNFLFSLRIAICLTLPIGGYAQSISEVLSKIAGENAKNYIQPAVDAFGANLNSGLYHTADVHGILGFDIGVRVMAVFVPDDQLKFTAVLPDSVTLPNSQRVASGYPRTYETATIFGSKGVDSVRGSGVPAFPFPGGVDFKFIPLLVPQASVGLPLGTEVMLRYLPALEISKSVGKVGFLGVGIRHDVDQYIPMPGFPIDISAQFVYQTFTLKDTADANLFDASAISFGAQASKTFAILTLYGGLAYESAKITIGPYSFTDRISNTKVTVNPFDLNAKNNFRFTVGASLKLAIINFNIDYSVASTPVVSAGFSIGLR